MEKIGKYSISGELGKGGMGVVYRGLDPYIGRTVAIKTIRLDMLRQDGGREEALKRFIREAQAAGNLSHPNIVTIYDVGEHEDLIYIAMECIEGKSLESLMQQGRVFTLAEIARLFAQLAAALDYAHQKGIVHRDIKPANILVGEDLKVSLVDFGIARTSASTMTQTGMLMGTPRYMSPEQIAGKKVDNRADIFSLGAILYELLTRHNPFEGESITTVIYKIMHADIEPLSDFNKNLPPGLEGVVRKALARAADARYRTCGELQAALQGCLPAPPTVETARRSASPLGETLRIEPTAVVPTTPAKSRRPLVLAALVAVVAVVVVVIGINRRRTLPPTAAGEDSVQTTEPTALESGPGPVQPETRGSAAMPAAGTAVAGTGPAPAGSAAVPGTQKRLPPPSGEAAGDQAAVEEQAADEPVVAIARNQRGYLEGVFANHSLMIQIPAGEFTIGSPPAQGDDDEHPAHRVFISGFWLGKSEVTFAQFDAFCAESGRPLPRDEGWGRGSRPVINVTWEDAGAYCRWLSQKSGRRFRLPSEAEWEKAARERYPWGKKEPGPSLANGKGREDGYAFTAPVGAFPAGASPYGILDLAGNVWEWTTDWYDAAYSRLSPDRDPRGPAAGESRSVRGGSWTNGPDLIRSANRSSERPDNRLNVLGFRVAMDDR